MNKYTLVFPNGSKEEIQVPFALVVGGKIPRLNGEVFVISDIYQDIGESYSSPRVQVILKPLSTEDPPELIPGIISETLPALTKRELFTLVAMHGALASGNVQNGIEKLAEASVYMADALIKELEKEK